MCSHDDATLNSKRQAAYRAARLPSNKSAPPDRQPGARAAAGRWRGEEYAELQLARLAPVMRHGAMRFPTTMSERPRRFKLHRIRRALALYAVGPNGWAAPTEGGVDAGATRSKANLDLAGLGGFAGAGTPPPFRPSFSSVLDRTTWTNERRARPMKRGTQSETGHANVIVVFDPAGVTVKSLCAKPPTKTNL